MHLIRKFYKKRTTTQMKPPKLWRPKYEINSIKFQFNPHDDDPNPSVPHGDNEKYKLDTVNGNILYRHNQQVYKKIKLKELDRIYADKGFQIVALKSAAYYKEKYSWLKINSPIDNMKEKGYIKEEVKGRRRLYKHKGHYYQQLRNNSRMSVKKSKDFIISIDVEID